MLVLTIHFFIDIFAFSLRLVPVEAELLLNITTNETPPLPLDKPEPAAPPHAEAVTDKPRFQKQILSDTVLMHSVNTNMKQVNPAPATFPKPSAARDEKPDVALRFSEAASMFSVRKNDTSSGRDDWKTEQRVYAPPEQSASLRLKARDAHRGLTRRPPEKDLDPLSTFMMLRSQQTVTAAAQSSASTAGTD